MEMREIPGLYFWSVPSIDNIISTAKCPPGRLALADKDTTWIVR